jgi:hypothetical protein
LTYGCHLHGESEAVMIRDNATDLRISSRLNLKRLEPK